MQKTSKSLARKQSTRKDLPLWVKTYLEDVDKQITVTLFNLSMVEDSSPETLRPFDRDLTRFWNAASRLQSGISKSLTPKKA